MSGPFPLVGARVFIRTSAIVGSFGHVVLLTDDEYAESDWDNYGVAWDAEKGLTAVPKCSRRELKEFGPLMGERNNLRFARSEHKGGQDGQEQHPSVVLVSTRAIRGNEVLLVAYGRSFSCVLKQQRTDAKKLVNEHKKARRLRPLFQAVRVSPTDCSLYS